MLDRKVVIANAQLPIQTSQSCDCSRYTPTVFVNRKVDCRELVHNLTANEPTRAVRKRNLKQVVLNYPQGGLVVLDVCIVYVRLVDTKIVLFEQCFCSLK